VGGGIKMAENQSKQPENDLNNIRVVMLKYTISLAGNQSSWHEKAYRHCTYATPFLTFFLLSVLG
jgi:hypothetical protein